MAVTQVKIIISKNTGFRKRILISFSKGGLFYDLKSQNLVHPYKPSENLGTRLNPP